MRTPGRAGSAHDGAAFRPYATVSYPPGEALARAHRRFGPVLRGAVGLQRYVYLLGPEANQFIFGHDELFTMAEAFRGLVPVDGPTSLLVSDGPDHQRRRRLVQPAMHRSQVAGYVATMVRHADAELATWTPGRQVDAYASLRAAIRRSTIETLFGPELAGDEPAIGADLQPLLHLVDRTPQMVEAHRRLGTPVWRRAIAARARLDARINEAIAQAGTEDGYVLSTLVHGRDGDHPHAGLSDVEVRDQIVTLIAAGHETTSAAAGWLTHVLGLLPQVRERCHAELVAQVGGREPAAADLAAMAYHQAVVHEVLRLYPPAVVSARYAASGFEFAGRRVRPGTMVVYSPYVTHRSEDVFDDAAAFRPERWIDDSGAFQRRPPHEFIPFGGGAHRCIGSGMAVTQLQVVLARLLVHPGYEVVPRRVRSTSFAALRPKGGLSVRVRPAGPGRSAAS